MELSAGLKEDALVGRLLHQGVLEDVLEFGGAGPLPDELSFFEAGEVPVKCPFRFGHAVEHPVEEAPPDDRS